MKKAGIVFIISTLFVLSAKAQDYKTALGVRLSSNDAVVNNSISFKHFLSGSTAIEALLSFGDPVALGVLIEKHKPAAVAGLSWFYGAGGYIGFGKDKNLGAQGILGLDYKIPSAPINLSLDWKPELNLIEDVSFEPAAVGLSLRFTFK